MFEGIPLESSLVSFSSTSILNDLEFQNFTSQYGIPEAIQANYNLDGSVSYMSARPLPQTDQQHLLYMQSFSFMKSGPNYFTERAHYASYLLLFTYSGSGVLEYGDKTYTLGPGDGFLIDCKKPHRYYTAATTWEHGDLHFCGGASDYIYASLFSEGAVVFHYARANAYQHQLEALLRLLVSSLASRMFEFSVGLQNLLLDIVHTAQESSAISIPEPVMKLQQYLDEHSSEEINADEMALVSSTSKYYLIRQFKKYVGFTPKEYLGHVRAEQAKKLLETTTLPGYRIGSIVGYPNEASFMRYFRKATNMTPQEYRRSLGGYVG